MNICEAVSQRINTLLMQNKITLYRLEQNAGILHGTMMCIMNNRNKNVTLKTIIQISRGFNMTLLEFLNDPIFEDLDLEIY
ncbi:MAG: helix-turn-helix transcriptional regulator [Clostridia bacterium]|nr:helix-turn-helix transcriptional regulator [Clostridia bacterium]